MAPHACLLLFILLGWFDGSLAQGDEFGVADTKALRDRLVGVNSSYDSSTRPNKTVTVDIWYHLLSINGLDTKASTFKVSGYFDMFWLDYRLQWPSSEDDDMFIDAKLVWTPKFAVLNEVDKLEMVKGTDVPVHVFNGGNVYWNPPLIKTTDCTLDVTYFPCDRQTCTIELITWAYTTNQLKLSSSLPINMQYFSENVEWTLLNSSVTSSEETVARSDTASKSYSRLKISFTVKRRPTFHIISTVIPTILMAYLCPLIFKLPAATGEKVGFIVTIFLAYVVLLTLVQDAMPSATMTPSAISAFLTMTTIIAALCVGLTVIILSIYHRPDDEPATGSFNQFGLFLERMLCTKSRAEDYSKMEMRDDPRHPRGERKRVLKTVRLLKWQQIANLLDRFCFRLMVIFTTLFTITFICFLFIGWLWHPSIYVMPNVVVGG